MTRIYGTGTARVTSMGVTRRPRGSLREPVKVALTFEGPASRRLTAMAHAAGITRSEMAQWLIDSEELDASGAPKRWTEKRHDEELPTS